MEEEEVEITDKEFNQEYYNNLIIRFGVHSSDIINAIDLVAKYVKREKLILVGGMAIDLALKHKGSGIYGEDTIADHDFYSTRHFIDAYEIGQWLYRTKYPDVTVINATHASTMRVRVRFESVADVTYMPPNIFEIVPTLIMRGYRIIHPNYQLINQHKALSGPYVNQPMEVIRSSRWKKDMERYDLLYQHYPLHVPREQFGKQPPMREIKTKVLKGANYCYSGMAALIYWLAEAKKEGFEYSREFGEFGEEFIRQRSPVAIFTDDIHGFYNLMKSDKKQFFHRQIDHLPRSFRTDEYEIYDNYGEQFSASNEGAFYVANLQQIMVFFLTKLIINKLNMEDFYHGYLACRDLIKWAACKFYEGKSDSAIFAKLLPSVQVYGKETIAEHYLVNKDKDRAKLKPKELFSYSFRNMSVPDEYRLFSYDNSWIFDFDGLECEDFIKSELK